MGTPHSGQVSLTVAALNTLVAAVWLQYSLTWTSLPFASGLYGDPVTAVKVVASVSLVPSMSEYIVFFHLLF